MSTKIKTGEVNTKASIKNDGVARLPHERDEAPDKQSIAPRKEMKQAYSDLADGLVDTDLHGQRGVEEVVMQSVKQRQNIKKKSRP